MLCIPGNRYCSGGDEISFVLGSELAWSLREGQVKDFKDWVDG